MFHLHCFRFIRQLAAVITCILTAQCSGQDSMSLVSGDVTLAAMFPVRAAASGGGCDKYETESIQGLMAIKWLVDRLNIINYVPGVTIGLEAYSTCHDPEKAVAATASSVENFGVLGEPGSNTSLLFGIVGPTTTSEAMAVSRFIGLLPEEQRVLQISGSASGQDLQKRTLYPNFFRVIPPDSTQVQVMAQLLEQLNWNYVAIVFEDDDYGRSAATELRRLAEERRICVPLFESLPPSKSAAFTPRIESILSSVQDHLIRGMVVVSGTKEVIAKLSGRVTYLQVILSEEMGLQRAVLENSAGTIQPLARGALITSPQYTSLAEFRTFWNNLWDNRAVFLSETSMNGWLAAFYGQETECNPPVSDSCWVSKLAERDALKAANDDSGKGLNLHTWYHVKAAAVMAAFLKKIHTNVQCGSGVCDAFKTAIETRAGLNATLQQASLSLSDMRSVSTTFDNVIVQFDGNGDVRTRPGQPEYAVYNFKEESSAYVFRQVGNFSSNTLTVNTSATQFYDDDNNVKVTWANLPPAQCPDHHDCVTCKRDLTRHVVFKEGDSYIVAMVPVYAKHPTNPLDCGEINTFAGADLVQAILFAANQVNEKNGQFRGVLGSSSLGVVVLNTCGNPLMVRQRLLDLHSGRMTLPDGRNTSFLVPNIFGYLGAYYSSSSIAASDTLTSVGRTFVEVSATSTSPALSDRTTHPYFMRLAVPDTKQAKVMLAIAVGLGANYIQVIYDETTTYSTGLYQEIVKEANSGRYDVCIAQAIATSPRSDVSEYKWIVDRLRTKSSAKVVLIVQHKIEVNKTMHAVLPLLTDDDFIFVGSESWGRRQQVIEGQTKLEGSLVVSQEVAVDQVFQREFLGQDPLSDVNPWLRDFWEKRENCYFDKSFLREDKSGKCPADVAETYTQDTWAPYHINAVYALALGFHKALVEHCQGATRKCDKLTSARLVEAMKKVTLDLHSTGRQNELFDSNGDGLGGYKVLQVVRDITGGDEMIYQDVGLWTQTDGLNLRKDELKLPDGFKSVCPNDVECQCITKATLQTSTDGASEANTSVPLPVTVGVSVGLLVIIIILIVIIVIPRLRRAHDPSSSGFLKEMDILDRGNLPDLPVTPHTSPRQNHYSADMTNLTKSTSPYERNVSRDELRDVSDGAWSRGRAGSCDAASGGSYFSRRLPPTPGSVHSGESCSCSCSAGSRAKAMEPPPPENNPYDVPTGRGSAHTYDMTE